MTSEKIVLVYGSKAELVVQGGSSIPCIITAVQIRGQLVSYEVAYWSGAERRCEWVEACEVGPVSGTTFERVGFR